MAVLETIRHAESILVQSDMRLRPPYVAPASHTVETMWPTHVTPLLMHRGSHDRDFV